MFYVDVELDYDAQLSEDREVCGWYLPHTDVGSWIVVLEELESQVNELHFFLAPTDAHNVAALGLIAIGKSRDPSPQQAKSAQISWRIPVGSIPLTKPLGHVSGKTVLIPWHSKLSLSAGSNRLKKAVESLYARYLVWLPQIGLIGLEADDEIELTNLLRPPQSTNRLPHWSAPIPQDRVPDRIDSISVRNPFDLDNLFQQEQKDIGGDSSELMNLNEKGEPEPDGIKSYLKKSMRKVMAKWVDKGKKGAAASSVGGKPNGKQSGTNPGAGQNAGQGSGNSLGQNISNYLSNLFNGSLQAERDKQIEKLLNLMARDPDRALKYSIPMGGGAGGMPRGVASPGAKLGQHNVDFSLSSLGGGGGAVDPWSIRDDLRKKLMESYREQARREIAAGRHRRAAYIHAHLLGDFAGAATILENGKFFSEAAALYGQHLNRPRDQARCLTAAARFDEAAAIYEKLEDFVAAGDLWIKVDQPEKAKHAYERGVELAISRQNILGAALLLDKQLSDRPRAEQLLWQQWPYGTQPYDAAVLAFRWLAESNRHNEAQERFRHMVGLVQSAAQQLLLARVCQSLHESYPQQILRNAAEDQCRLSLADGMESLPKSEIATRLDILRSLHPSDHFLQRDARRFAEQATKSSSLPPPFKQPNSPLLQSLTRLKLTEAAFIDALMIGPEVFAIGWKSSKLIACRVHCQEEALSSQHKIDFAILSRETAGLAQACLNRNISDPEIYISFFGNELGFSPSKLISPIGNSPWTIRETPYPQMLRCALGEDQSVWTLSTDLRSLTVYRKGLPSTYDVTSALGSLVEDENLLGLDNTPNSQSIQLCCVGNQPFLALGNLLLSVKHGHIVLINAFDSPITHIAPSLAHSLLRVMVSTANGLACWYVGSEELEYIARGETYREATFLHGGRIVALSDRAIELYERNQKGTVLRATEAIGSLYACRLLPISVGIFGLLCADGTILRWKHR